MHEAWALCETAIHHPMKWILLLLPIATTFIGNTAHGQYRLNKFTTYNPLRASLILPDGATILALQYGDTALVWKGDALGAALWTRRITDPGTEIALTDAPQSGITRVDAYTPTIIDNNPAADDTMVQRVRVTRIDSDGEEQWSSSLTMTWINPLEFPGADTRVSCVTATDGGSITALHSFATFHSVLHVIKHDASGALQWAYRYYQPGSLYSIWSLTVSEYPVDILRPSSDGGAFLLDHMQIGNGDTGILHIDGDGTPSRFVEARYLGGTFGGMTSPARYGIDGQGDLLLAYRAGGTGGMSSFILIRLNDALEVEDKDMYYDFGSLYDMQGLDVDPGAAVLIRIAANASNTTSTFIRVDEDGALLSSHRSSFQPYVAGQQIGIRPAAARINSGITALCISMPISHPVLGTIGHFVGRQELDVADPQCFFAPVTAQHIDVPDSLLALSDLPLPAVSDADPLIETGSVVTYSDLINTISGCLSTVGIEVPATNTSVVIAPNPVAAASPFTVTANETVVLSLHDASGRTVATGIMLPPNRSWTGPVLRPGLYHICSESMNTGMRTTWKLVVQ